MRFSLAGLVLLGMTLATFASDAQLSGHSTVVRRLNEWLGAFNSQNEATYRIYVEQHAPAISKFIRDDHRYSVYLDGLKLVAVTKSTPTSVEAELRDRWSDATTRITIHVEPKPPHRIVSADFAPPSVDYDRITPFVSEHDLMKAVAARVRDQARAKRFSGIVVVARGDRIVTAAASADVLRERPGCEAQHLQFNLASMGKMATAVGILQQHDAGRLALSDPLSKYLPEYANRAFADQVTLRQLLNHTGGAGDFFVDEVAQQRETLTSISQLIALLDDRKPEFDPPGLRYAYSNFGFVLLGRVLEVVTGISWDRYVDQRVLRRTGSESACQLELPGMTRSDDGVAWILRKPGLERMPTPAGGIAASASELITFINGVRKHDLVSRRAKDLLWTGTVDIPGGRYALGFQHRERAGLVYIGHGGAAPGINNALDLYPASGYVVIVLNRLDPPYGNRLADFIGHRMGRLASADRVQRAPP